MISLRICHIWDSYAIGGLAGGESKDLFWHVVAQCTATLPEDKPCYVMVFENANIILAVLFLIHYWKGNLSCHMSPVSLGCWISFRYRSLQRSRCWHVWLCLPYPNCTIWYCPYPWGMHAVLYSAVLHIYLEVFICFWHNSSPGREFWDSNTKQCRKITVPLIQHAPVW